MVDMVCLLYTSLHLDSRREGTFVNNRLPTRYRAHFESARLPARHHRRPRPARHRYRLPPQMCIRDSDAGHALTKVLRNVKNLVDNLAGCKGASEAGAVSYTHLGSAIRFLLTSKDIRAVVMTRLFPWLTPLPHARCVSIPLLAFRL